MPIVAVSPIGPPTLVPPLAALLARGVSRALDQLGYASLVEFPLANGRRIDVIALGQRGDLVAVEIKSSVADFRADRKWTSYREFVDRLYFAVATGFPTAPNIRWHPLGGEQFSCALPGSPPCGCGRPSIRRSSAAAARSETPPETQAVRARRAIVALVL